MKLCEKWKEVRCKKNPNPWCKLIILLCWYCFVVTRTLFYPQERLLECSLLYLVWRFVSWIKHYKLCSTQTIQYSFIESCGKIHLLPSQKKSGNTMRSIPLSDCFTKWSENVHYYLLFLSCILQFLSTFFTQKKCH